jgi:hypothetical protein
MTGTTMSLHTALCSPASASASRRGRASQRAEPEHGGHPIHHPNNDKNVFMPFVPAIKIKSGKILWLAGTTALPVYHDHPHKRDEIQKYMVNDLEAQVSRIIAD